MKEDIKKQLYWYKYNLKEVSDINTMENVNVLTNKVVNEITNIFYFYFARIIITMLFFNIWFLLLIFAPNIYLLEYIAKLLS